MVGCYLICLKWVFYDVELAYHSAVQVATMTKITTYVKDTNPSTTQSYT